MEKGTTLVARTARALAEISLSVDDGAFLGAEDDLLTRLGVSRPTLRQAAKIAENDRLVSVRRGIKGGFYAARPDAADAIRTLSRFLRLKGATLEDIMAVSRLVSEEAAVLACGCVDEALRTRLAAFMAGLDKNDSVGAMIRAEADLVHLIAAMSGNAAIELVMEIGFSFGMEEEETGLYRDAGHRGEARKMQTQLCAAILDRDADIARLLMRRRSVMLAGWLREAG